MDDLAAVHLLKASISVCGEVHPHSRAICLWWSSVTHREVKRSSWRKRSPGLPKPANAVVFLYSNDGGLLPHGTLLDPDHAVDEWLLNFMLLLLENVWINIHILCYFYKMEPDQIKLPHLFVCLHTTPIQIFGCFILILLLKVVYIHFPQTADICRVH